VTDAERWRWIAQGCEHALHHPQFKRAGLCECLHLDMWRAGQFAGFSTNEPIPGDQYQRMAEALQLFQPGKGYNEYSRWWNFDGEGQEARVLAACFLAAMADADGGNHASRRDW
jgi:hypothetical protein